jgi:hypothetical protein
MPDDHDIPLSCSGKGGKKALEMRKRISVLQNFIGGREGDGSAGEIGWPARNGLV